MWTATYLPMRNEGEPDPSRSGFATAEEAEEYIISRMCRHCVEEREAALAGDPESSEWPGCACEWLVIETEKYDKCETFDDMMDAVGAKVIWRKDDTAS